MKARYLVLCSLLAAACSSSAPEEPTPSDTSDQNDPTAEPADLPGLEPRAPTPSNDLPTPVPGQAYRLVVKFTDATRARIAPSGDITSPRDLSIARSVASKRGYAFKQTIELPVETLRTMQARAAGESGTAQPDLAGIMTVGGDGEDPEQLLAAAREFQKLDAVEYVHVEALNVEPPTDIAPPTASFQPEQTYRTTLGIDADYAATKNAKGQGIKVSDVEYAWRATHEELNNINLNLEPGQTINYAALPAGSEDHGTAVVGILAGQENGYGVTGIAPLSTIRTYPQTTVSRGYAPATALANAIASSAAGDIVVIEAQTLGAAGEYVPLEYDPTIWTIVKNAEAAGVIVVAAAGNGGANLDAANYATYRSRGDSGAIIVGAGTTGRARFNTGWSGCYGSRVNVQGWGTSVVTLAYGDRAAYNNDPNQKYTAVFSGTSSATAIVGGAVAATQSYAVQKLGRRLTPAEMRTLLVSTGRAQVGMVTDNIGPLPDLRNAFNVLDRWPASYSNRVLDPGFELQPSAAVAAPWSGVGNYRWIEQNLGKQRSGLDAAILFTDPSAGAGWKAYTQSVNLTPNVDYRVTAWIRGTSGVNGRLTMNNSTYGYPFTSVPFVPQSQTAYQQIPEAVFNSGGATSSPLEIGYTYATASGNQWINLDDFEVSPVNPLTALGNVLSDPSFEGQKTSVLNVPWQSVGGAGGIELGVGKSRRGPNNALIASSDSGQTKGIKQRVALRPNTFYKFTGYVQGSTNIVASMNVLNGGTWLAAASMPVKYPNKYEPFVVEFNSGPFNWADLTIAYVSPGGFVSMQLDDLSLVPTALAAPSNLVRDPGYELHTSAALQDPYFAFGSASVATNSGPKSGNKNGVLSSTDTGVYKAMAQNLAVAYMTPYRLKVSALSNVPLAGKLGVKLRTGQIVLEQPVNLTTAYQDLIMDFTSGATTSVNVYFTYTSPGGSVTVKLDDWALTRR